MLFIFYSAKRENISCTSRQWSMASKFKAAKVPKNTAAKQNSILINW